MTSSSIARVQNWSWKGNQQQERGSRNTLIPYESAQWFNWWWETCQPFLITHLQETLTWVVWEGCELLGASSSDQNSLAKLYMSDFSFSSQVDLTCNYYVWQKSNHALQATWVTSSVWDSSKHAACLLFLQSHKWTYSGTINWWH